MPHAAAATPQLLRRVNARSVLRHIRGADAATGTELMALTGLTRASVIAVCEDLIRRGWIVELDQPPGSQGGTGLDAAAPSPATPSPAAPSPAAPSSAAPFTRQPGVPARVRKGRPARRFAFNQEAGFVLGLDI